MAGENGVAATSPTAASKAAAANAPPEKEQVRRGRLFGVCFAFVGGFIMLFLTLLAAVLSCTVVFTPFGVSALARILRYGFRGDVNFTNAHQQKYWLRDLATVNAVILAPLLFPLNMLCFLLLGLQALLFYPFMVLAALCVPLPDGIRFTGEFHYSYTQAVRFTRSLILSVILPVYAPDAVRGASKSALDLTELRNAGNGAIAPTRAVDTPVAPVGTPAAGAAAAPGSRRASANDALGDVARRAKRPPALVVGPGGPVPLVHSPSVMAASMPSLAAQGGGGATLAAPYAYPAVPVPQPLVVAGGAPGAGSVYMPGMPTPLMASSPRLAGSQMLVGPNGVPYMIVQVSPRPGSVAGIERRPKRSDRSRDTLAGLDDSERRRERRDRDRERDREDGGDGHRRKHSSSSRLAGEHSEHRHKSGTHRDRKHRHRHREGLSRRQSDGDALTPEADGEAADKQRMRRTKSTTDALRELASPAAEDVAPSPAPGPLSAQEPAPERDSFEATPAAATATEAGAAPQAEPPVDAAAPATAAIAPAQEPVAAPEGQRDRSAQPTPPETPTEDEEAAAAKPAVPAAATTEAPMVAPASA